MTRDNFVAQLVRPGRRKAAGQFLDALFDAIAAHVEAGDTIRWPGFGTFYRKTQKARRTVLKENEYQSPEIISIGFRASKLRKRRGS